jgi:hypothetical protein
MVLLLPLTVWLVLSMPVAAQEKDLYQQMVAAMEAWLAGNPVRTFQSADAQQVFEWKVGLARLGSKDKERFMFYENLLSQIGTNGFSYNGYEYNQRSIRALMLRSYPSYDYCQGDREFVVPHLFFADLYAWYRTEVSARAEQCYWLWCFLGFFDTYFDAPTVDAIVSANRTTVHEIIVQYLALAHSYLAEHAEEVKNIGDVYADRVTVAIGQSDVDIMLSPLAAFCRRVGRLLTSEERSLITAFVIPDYATSDLAVQIYVALSP